MQQQRNRPHERLDVWNKSIELVESIYAVTKSFTKEELYGLVSQTRRASVSISSNIAEGASRHTKTEFKQFLYVARGSLSELETQMLISHRLNYIGDREYFDLTNRMDCIGKMLTGLIKSIK